MSSSVVVPLIDFLLFITGDHYVAHNKLKIFAFKQSLLFVQYYVHHLTIEHKTNEMIVDDDMGEILKGLID